jgi:hypothetical protein
MTESKARAKAKAEAKATGNRQKQRLECRDLSAAAAKTPPSVEMTDGRF